MVIFMSCEDFLNTDLSKAKVEADKVFSNDVTATSAVAGIYASFLAQNNFASGASQSVAVLCGLSADELNYYRTTTSFEEFEENSLASNNSNLRGLWNSMYNSIFRANSVLENLQKSDEVTAATKSQLQGEAYFVRAFCNFYLVNLFGAVPLVKTSDYRINAILSRTAPSEIYSAIVDDLLKAQDLLGEDYITVERVRPNKACATALLSRTYLYNGEWAKAETTATDILTNANYGLLSNLDGVFIKNSKEAIWQLANNYNTNEAHIFILSGPPNGVTPFAINPALVAAFEPGDLRKDKWIKGITSGTQTYYYPFKYKLVGGPESNPPIPLSEYSMVFRVAEQYLIRAEARCRQGNLSKAIEDIDAIRGRAGIPLIAATNPGITQNDLMEAITKEKQLELATEWGHRWLDLKRTQTIDDVLGLAKSTWTHEHALFPLPQDELDRNPKLAPQNPGY